MIKLGIIKTQLSQKEAIPGPATEHLSLMLKKLEAFLTKHYRATVKTLTSEEIPEELQLQLNQQRLRPLQVADSFYFSTYLADSIQIALQLNNATLDANDLQKIQDTLDLFAECGTSFIESTNDSKRILHALLPQEFDSKVIPLRSFRPANAEQISTPRQLSSPSFRFQIPCMIEASNYDDIKKMALELHNNSDRIAFIYFNELDPQTTSSSDGLAELSGTTLFIPDVCLLTSTQQIALFDLLSKRSSQEAPQIIAGTLLPYAELLNRQVVHCDLLRRLAVAYLRMTKPFSEYSKSGVFNFFLTSLTSRQITDLFI